MGDELNSASDKGSRLQQDLPLPLPSSSLDASFAMSLIMRNNGGVLLVQKSLTMSDINRRLMIPKKDFERHGLLTVEEIQVLKVNKQRLQVDLIDFSSHRTTVILVKKRSYELQYGWFSVVKKNKLVEGDEIKLWLFRLGTKLCLALARVIKEVKEEGREVSGDSPM